MQKEWIILEINTGEIIETTRPEFYKSDDYIILKVREKEVELDKILETFNYA